MSHPARNFLADVNNTEEQRYVVTYLAELIKDAVVFMIS